MKKPAKPLIATVAVLEFGALVHDASQSLDLNRRLAPDDAFVVTASTSAFSDTTAIFVVSTPPTEPISLDDFEINRPYSEGPIKLPKTTKSI
jgi:hypothetical protein